MSTKDMTIILTSPVTGQPEAFRVDLAKLDIGTLPKHMAGPFLYRFEVDTGDGPREFRGNVMMSDTRIVAAFEEFPIIAKVIDEWTVAGPVVRVAELGGGGKDRILALKASLFGKSHIWIDIDKANVTGGTYDAKKKEAYALPFWNFYNDGRVCMGGLHFTAQINPIKALNLFLSAYTTPHVTFNDRGLRFAPNKDKTQIVCDRVPSCSRFDWPLAEEVFTGKPIATITP